MEGAAFGDGYTGSVHLLVNPSSAAANMEVQDPLWCDDLGCRVLDYLHV